MRRLVRKYTDVVYSALAAVDVVAAALVVDRIDHRAYVWASVIGIVLVASLVTHYFVYRSATQVGRDAQVEVLGGLLRAAAKSLVFPESWDVVPVRAYCHRLDRKLRTLHYVTSCASHDFDDQFTDVPLDAVDEDGRLVFVIADAVINGGTVFRELPAAREVQEQAVHVWDEIRYVLACPVFERNAVRTQATCLGVVSFDTSLEGGKKIDLGGQRARDMIMEISSTVSVLWS